MNLKPQSVRGRIRAFLEKNAHLLAGPVLEVGSRDHSEGKRWWMNNRTLRPDCEWVGIDMQEGHGVDLRHDLTESALYADRLFGSAVVSEVLEHVSVPRLFCRHLRQSLRTGAKVLVTLPFGFPEHGFPDDYHRFTESGLKNLAWVAGFKQTHYEVLHRVRLPLSDHGEPEHAQWLTVQQGAIWEALPV